jgi:Na+/alanine symporter
MERGSACAGWGVVLALPDPGVRSGVQRGTSQLHQPGDERIFGIPDWVSGLALVVLSGLIIFGGIPRHRPFRRAGVPFMALAYILMALFVAA